jgi:hypothetical protein
MLGMLFTLFFSELARSIVQSRVYSGKQFAVTQEKQVDGTEEGVPLRTRELTGRATERTERPHRHSQHSFVDSTPGHL